MKKKTQPNVKQKKYSNGFTSDKNHGLPDLEMNSLSFPMLLLFPFFNPQSQSQPKSQSNSQMNRTKIWHRISQEYDYY